MVGNIPFLGAIEQLDFFDPNRIRIGIISFLLNCVRFCIFCYVTFYKPWDSLRNIRLYCLFLDNAMSDGKYRINNCKLYVSFIVPIIAE